MRGSSHLNVRLEKVPFQITGFMKIELKLSLNSLYHNNRSIGVSVVRGRVLLGPLLCGRLLLLGGMPVV